MTQSIKAGPIAIAALALFAAAAAAPPAAAAMSRQSPKSSDKPQKPAEPAPEGEAGKEGPAGKEGKGEPPAKDAQASQPAPAPAATQDDDDLSIDTLEPDFTIITLPTTLRVPRYKGAFRVTHRFGRPLGEGDFGDLLEDFFGLDSGAGLGLEYRFGIARGLQAAVHRTNGKVIQLLGEYNAMKQGDTRPLGIDLLVAVEGRDNFSERYATAVGAVVSRKLGSVGAIYFEPIFVANTPRVASQPEGDDYTMMLGLGTRLRIRPTVYLVGEFIPRLAGYAPRDHYITFGIEKRKGGHSFQLNFSNSFWTTFGQMATGGFDDWYLGFNIARKFF